MVDYRPRVYWLRIYRSRIPVEDLLAKVLLT
jgi:hypothetical protein